MHTAASIKGPAFLQSCRSIDDPLNVVGAQAQKAVEHIRSNAAELRKDILSESGKEAIATSLEVLNSIREKLTSIRT